MPKNTIQKSVDYEEFSFLNANRELARGHIESLKKAYEEIGNMTMVQPILVNDKLEIIDGQHRFVACQELGLPIYYMVVAGLGVNEARSMNILHRQWTTRDFAESYAATGNKNYQQYLELLNTYELQHSTIVAYVTGIYGAQGAMKGFREGNFVIDDFAEANKRLGMLSEAIEIERGMRDRNASYALLKIMRSPNYNHKYFLRKLKTHGSTQFQRFAVIDEQLRNLEHIYNYQRTEANRERLY